MLCFSMRLICAATPRRYPALLAEALDHLQAHRFEIPREAEKLGVSSTQLVRLFKKCPAAWVAVNKHREALGLLALK